MDAELRFPFSDRLAQDHGTLRTLMRWIEAELARQCHQELQHDGPILGPFRVLCDHLRGHFRFEERQGFLKEVGGRLSDEQDTVGRLVRQHRSFEQRMAAIEADLALAAREEGVLTPRTVGDLRCLFQDLREHDREEERLARRLGLG